MTSEKAAVDQLTTLAAKFDGDLTSDQTWKFNHSRPCTAFTRAAEALGFQMWSSFNLAGLLPDQDDDEYVSCVDGKPVKK